MTKKAKVIYVEKPYKIKFVYEELKEIESNEIFCITEVSSISPGTELGAYQGLPHLRKGVTYPRLVGYLNVARVEKCGIHVKGYKRGDRILSFTSHRDCFVIKDDEVLFKLPKKSSSKEISMTYLFQLGQTAILKSNIKSNSKVCIIGLGAIGLATVAIGYLSGAKITTISDHGYSRRIAKFYGSHKNHSRKNMTKDKFDTIISTTNTWSDWKIALKIARMNGNIAVLGFPGRNEKTGDFNPLESNYFYQKQLNIFSAGMMPQSLPGQKSKILDEKASIKSIAKKIANKKLVPEKLISGSFSANEIQIAYEKLIHRKNNEITFNLVW